MTAAEGFAEDGGAMIAEQMVSRKAPALLLVNPEAGGGRALEYLPRIERYLASQKFPYEVEKTNHVEKMEAHARAAAANGTRLLISAGGDGTFQAVVNAVDRSKVVVGILPLGGGNDFAASAGVPLDPVAAAAAVLRRPIRTMDLLRARTADGRVRLYAGGGGIGLDAEAARYAGGRYRRLPGTLRYVASALAALRKFKPLEITVEFPGGEHATVKRSVLLAGVLNTHRYGAGLRLAPEARADDGWLDPVLVERMGLGELLDLLAQLTRSGEVRSAHITRMRARRVRLSADRPAMFHGDGEILGPAPVEIEVAAEAVRIAGAGGVE